MPIIIALAVAVIIGAGAWWYTTNTTTVPENMVAELDSRPLEEEATGINSEIEEADEPMTNELTETPPTETETDPATPTTFANGTYTASAEYITPARTRHEVAVTITLAEDTIVAAEVQYDDKPAGTFSNSNQERFHTSYPALVLGNSPDTISLSRVGGASLTSEAFNEALAEIQADARL